jgi:hypothetical protein
VLLLDDAGGDSVRIHFPPRLEAETWRAVSPYQRAGGVPMDADKDLPEFTPSPPSESPPPPTGAQADLLEKKARNWAVAAHLSALVGFVGVPFGHLFGPLAVWLLKRDEYPFVDDQGREALNFQISILLYSLASGLLILCFCLGLPLLLVIQLFNLLSMVVAAVKAGEGKPFRYPLCIRFLKA